LRDRLRPLRSGDSLIPNCRTPGCRPHKRRPVRTKQNGAGPLGPTRMSRKRASGYSPSCQIAYRRTLNVSPVSLPLAASSV
jgi:hypothetical protein